MSQEDRRKNIIGLIMFSIFMVILYVLVVKEAKASEEKIKNSIVYLTKKYKTKKLSQKRLNNLAKWILIYSKKWNIDPLVVVCIAHHESRFKDYPRRVKVRRCRTKTIDGKKVKKCKLIWPGERGILQIIPIYARKSFKVCTGRNLYNYSELYNAKINLCTGIHSLAERRKTLAKRSSPVGRGFVVRGAWYRRTKKFAPCGWRHKLFCKKDKYAPYCKKLWWVGAWNWGSHRVFCNRVGKIHNFSAYPMRIIEKYVAIVKRFGK